MMMNEIEVSIGGIVEERRLNTIGPMSRFSTS